MTIRHAVFVALALAPPCAAGSVAQLTGSQSLTLTDVNVVDVRAGSILTGRTVVIEDGRIASVGPAGSSDVTRSNPEQVIDGAGRFLIPGLWDMHVHLANPAAPDLLMPQFIAHGVTGVRDMSTDCSDPDDGDALCIEDVRGWGRQIEAGELLGPRLLALSSFAVNPPWDYEITEEEARRLVRRLDERGVDIIKLYYRISPEAFGWIMGEAAALELAAGGHIPIRLTATEASNAGLRSLEHARDFLFDCFPGSADFRASTMSQNPPIDVLRSMVDDHDVALCDEIIQTFIRNETWYVPTHVTRRMDAFADDPEFRNDPRRKYLPGYAWEAWQRDADNMVSLAPTPEGRRIMRGFYERGLEITGRAHAAGMNIVLGTDAGDTYVFPGSGTHDELGEFVKAGLTPAEALASATWRAAEFLGRTEDHGSIEVGKVADLVLLRENPLEDIEHTRDIEAVIFGGRLTDRAGLDALLLEIERRMAALDR